MFNKSSFFLLVSVFILTFYIGFTPISACDLWGHLAFGRYMCENGVFPQQNPFLYTPHNIFINYCWLAQLILWGIYRFWGLLGLIIIKSLLIAFTFTLCSYHNLKKNSHPLVIFLFVLGSLFGATGLLIRPYLFTFLFLAVSLLLLEGELTKKKFICFLVLTLIWANLHSAFLLLFFVIGCYIAGGIIEAVFYPVRDRECTWYFRFVKSLSGVKNYILLLIGCMGICLINPYGIEVPKYAFYIRSLGWVFKYVMEWKSIPLKFSAFQPWLFLCFVVFASLFALKKRNSNHLKISHILILLGLGVSSLMYRRQLGLFTLSSFILLTPVISELIHPVRSKLPKTTATPSVGASNWVISIVFFCVTAAVAFTTIPSPFVKELPSAGNLVKDPNLPVKAVEFMMNKGIKGKIYNDYDAGHYLEFYLKNSKFYIDGKCLTYPSWVFLNQKKLAKGGENWRKYFDESADAMIIQWQKYNIPLWELADKWHTVYWDDMWIVVVPRISKNAPLISKYDREDVCTFTTPSSYRHFVNKGDKKNRQEMLDYLKEKNLLRSDIKIAWFMRGNLEGRTALEILQKTMEFSEEAPERAELVQRAFYWLEQAESHYTKGLTGSSFLWQRGVVRLWQGKVEKAKEDFAESIKRGTDKKKIREIIETYLSYPLHERKAEELLGWLSEEKPGFIRAWLKH
ncbi:MAG: hypothetical protein Q7J67_01005 [bacterium]|nr:hypothetical protein [bacterium]